MKLPLTTLTASSLLTLLVATGADAQSSQSYRIEEVTVTARKMEESLQTVPVAVSALSGEDLLRKNAVDIGQLEGMAPNVTFGRHGTFPNSAQITIRGMTSMDIERSFDPSVGVSIDGVFTATNANQMMDMFDVERVEILRGPQGTLFGRNTIGGTINVSRIKASTESLSGAVEATVGNYGRFDAKAALNLPLTESLATRLSLFSSNSDGYIDNTYEPGPDKLMGEETLAARLNVVWDASEKLSFNLNYDYLRDRSDTGYVLNMTTADGYVSGTDADGNLVKSPYVFCALGNPCNGKPNNLYNASVDSRNIADIDRDSVSLQADYQLSDQLTLTYVGSYSDHYEDIWLDWDGVSSAIIGYDGSTPINGTFFHTNARRQNEQTMTHEFRISGNLSENLDIVAGVYLYDMKYDITQTNNFTNLPLDIAAEQESESQAVFIQSNYNITDKLSLTLGLRYTEDEKVFSRQMSLFGGTLFAVNDLEQSWDETTYRVGADYQINDDLLVYASFATGYKAGGFNGRAGSTEVAQEPYDPETVETMELGVKSEWLDQRLRINAALFFSEYDDLQVDVNVPAPNGQNLLITNAASATSDGLEIELLALLSEHTRLTVNYGYLKAEYDDFSANLFGETDINGELITFDYSGNALRRAPENQLYVSLAQDWEMHGGMVTAEISYSWKDEQQTTIDNDDYLVINDYGLMDINITYDSGENWRLQAFVHNVTQEEEMGYQFRASNLWQFGTPATRPRMVGLTANYQF